MSSTVAPGITVEYRTSNSNSSNISYVKIRGISRVRRRGRSIRQILLAARERLAMDSTNSNNNGELAYARGVQRGVPFPGGASKANYCHIDHTTGEAAACCETTVSIHSVSVHGQGRIGRVTPTGYIDPHEEDSSPERPTSSRYIHRHPRAAYDFSPPPPPLETGNGYGQVTVLQPLQLNIPAQSEFDRTKQNDNEIEIEYEDSRPGINSVPISPPEIRASLSRYEGRSRLHRDVVTPCRPITPRCAENHHLACAHNNKTGIQNYEQNWNEQLLSPDSNLHITRKRSALTAGLGHTEHDNEDERMNLANIDRNQRHVFLLLDPDEVEKRRKKSGNTGKDENTSKSENAGNDENSPRLANTRKDENSPKLTNIQNDENSRGG